MLYCYVPVEIFCLTLWEKPINTGNILCLELIESTLSNLCVCVFYVQDSYLKTISSSSHVYYYSLCDIHIVSVFMFTGKWNLCHMVFLLDRRNLLKDLLYCCLGRFFYVIWEQTYMCVLIFCLYVFMFIFFICSLIQ